MILPMARLEWMRFLAAAEDDGVAALDAQRGGVAGDIRPAFIEKQDHAERDAHLADSQAVGPDVAFDDLPDGIDLGGDLLDAVGHGGDAFIVQLEALDQGRLHFGLLSRGDILGVSGQQRFPAGAKGCGYFSQRGGFHLAAQGGQLGRSFSCGFAEIQDILPEIFHGVILAAQRACVASNEDEPGEAAPAKLDSYNDRHAFDAPSYALVRFDCPAAGRRLRRGA